MEFTQKPIHPIELIAQQVEGASFASIDTVTDVKLKGGQKNPMQGEIRKVTIGSNVMLFSNKKTSGYDSMVRRRLEQEGKDPNSFELGKRAWGVRREDVPLVDHNGEVYLEVIFLKSGEVHYERNGRPIDKSMIEGLPDDRSEAEQGGLSDSNKVIIRTLKLGSIKRLAINKQVYVF